MRHPGVPQLDLWRNRAKNLLSYKFTIWSFLYLFMFFFSFLNPGIQFSCKHTHTTNNKINCFVAWLFWRYNLLVEVPTKKIYFLSCGGIALLFFFSSLMTEFRHNDCVFDRQRLLRKTNNSTVHVCVRMCVCVMWSNKVRVRTVEIFTVMKWGHLWAPVPESERENSPVGLLFDLDDFMARYNLINLLHHSALSQFYETNICPLTPPRSSSCSLSFSIWILWFSLYFMGELTISLRDKCRSVRVCHLI